MTKQIKQKNGYNYPKAGIFKTILWAILPLIIFGLVQMTVMIVTLFTVGASLPWDDQMKAVEQFSQENALLLSLIVFGSCIVILMPIWLKQKRYLPVVKKRAGAKIIVTGVVFALGVTFAGAFLAEPLAAVMKYIIPDGGYSSVSSSFLTGGNIFVQILTIVFIGPIAEEFIFRGIMLNRLMSRMPIWAAVVISGLAFGIYHMNSVQSVITTFLGIAIAILYVKTRSLVVCMVFHIINNGISLFQTHILANAGNNIGMITDIFFWISIAVIVIAIILSIIFFRSKGAEVETAE